MPRLPALLLVSLLLAAPAAHAGNVIFEGVVLRSDGVDLCIGSNRHVPHGWNGGWAQPGRYGHSSAWTHSRVQQHWPHQHHWGRHWSGHGGYDARDVRRAWRQGFQAGRHHDDSPRWHRGWSR